MHVPHEVFYFVVFLLSSGLPEAMHLGFSFWRGCDVGVRVLVAWVTRSAVDGDGVATLLVHSVDGGLLSAGRTPPGWTFGTEHTLSDHSGDLEICTKGCPASCLKGGCLRRSPWPLCRCPCSQSVLQRAGLDT